MADRISQLEEKIEELEDKISNLESVLEVEDQEDEYDEEKLN